MDIRDSIFYDFKLTKAKHKKIANFWVIWPHCADVSTGTVFDRKPISIFCKFRV